MEAATEAPPRAEEVCNALRIVIVEEMRRDVYLRKNKRTKKKEHRKLHHLTWQYSLIEETWRKKSHAQNTELAFIASSHRAACVILLHEKIIEQYARRDAQTQPEVLKEKQFKKITLVPTKIATSHGQGGPNLRVYFYKNTSA